MHEVRRTPRGRRGQEKSGKYRVCGYRSLSKSPWSWNTNLLTYFRRLDPIEVWSVSWTPFNRFFSIGFCVQQDQVAFQASRILMASIYFANNCNLLIFYDYFYDSGSSFVYKLRLCPSLFINVNLNYVVGFLYLYRA